MECLRLVVLAKISIFGIFSRFVSTCKLEEIPHVLNLSKILSHKSFGQRVHSSEKVFKKWVKCT